MRALVRFAIRLVGRESSLTTRVRKQEKVLLEREVSSCVWTVSSRLQTPEGIPGWEALLSLRVGYEAGCVVTRLSKEGELCSLQGCVLLDFRLRAGTCSLCPRCGHQRAMLPSMWQRNTSRKGSHLPAVVPWHTAQTNVRKRSEVSQCVFRDCPLQ